MFDLTGRTALVTGATGSIGAAIARSLHRQGAIVAVTGRRRDALDGLAASLRERVQALTCDLAHAVEATDLVPQAETAMGRLDILVINAGIIKGNPLTQMPDEDWNVVLEVDLTAAFRLARAAIQGMVRRRFGRVIGVTSLIGATGLEGQANYTAAKAGMTGMMKAIAQEYASNGITANCIAPGFITTPMAGVDLSEEQRETIVARVPAARFGTAEDVAAATAFLASDEASYVTGQTLHVNGGLVMF